MTGIKKDTTSPTPPLGPSPRTPISRTHKTKGIVTMEQASLLPEIRSSDDLLKKTEPLPTSLQADFIPEGLLKALVQPPPPPEQLGPSARNRNLNVSVMPKRRPPASVWGHPQRREKVKHLTEKIPCVCGAGRDISFLYDVPKKETLKKIDEADKSAVRVQEEDEPRKSIQLPDTLIPDEYHIVRNKGVLGLEYIEDNFATQPQDHEKHLVTFPSLNPTSRHEVKQLKKTMQEMMERLGINDLSAELKGPTQMHNLIELIKKEQNIYNIVFHELIRQVSVECLDRGELLSTLREHYSSLLNRVPLQIKGLHEEVMAQRALDRRLTEELMRFKSTIGILTSELSHVKEHDMEVSAQATQAQDDLKSALAESQKNASLLAEYHDLYELQRKRLETQVHMLSEEKELWSTAAYSLALKVTEEHSLTTSKRLHISEKAWAKLANHFTILLSDKDTVKLTSLQEYVDHWRDLVDDFNASIRMREEDMKKNLTDVQNALNDWRADFRKHVLNKEGHVAKGLDGERVSKLYTDIKNWGQQFNHEGEKFGGDTLLGGQESLMRIRRQVEGWTDCALNVFTRHRGEDGSNYPDHNEMLKMNELVDDLMSQYYVRLTGENGVATGLIHVINGLDSWEGKLNTLMHESNPLPDQEWGKLYTIMEDWIESIDGTKALIGTTQKEDDRSGKRPHDKIELNEVMKMTQKWLSSATNGIDSEDAKLVEQVNTLHTEMVKWMVQLLLRLAPDQASHSQESKEAVLEGTTSLAQLVANAKSLFHRLAGFSKYVTMCCNGIVMDLMQQKIDRHEEDADHEYRDLQRLKSECDGWIDTAKLLLAELTGEPFPETPAPSAMDMAPPIPDELKTREPTQDSLITEGVEDLDTSEPIEDQPEGVDKKAPQQEQEDSQTKDKEDIPTTAGDKGPHTSGDAAPETSGPKAGKPTGPDADVDASPETQVEKDGGAPVEDVSLVLQVIGHDENTRSAVLPEQPKSSAPIDARPPTTPGTPDPKRAFEAIAALETLQEQLISTEERAQVAEDRAANAEADLMKALERIKSLERKVAVTPNESEGPERPESVATEASVSKDKTAEPEKEKPKVAKEKEKEKRSSSKASNKSKKK